MGLTVMTNEEAAIIHGCTKGEKGRGRRRTHLPLARYHCFGQTHGAIKLQALRHVVDAVPAIIITAIISMRDIAVVA